MNEAEFLDDAVADPAPAFPWPPAEGESIVDAFGRTWRGATLQSRAFFSALPDNITGPALLYFLVIGIAVAGASLFWRNLFGTMLPDDSMFGELTSRAGGNPLVEFMLSPLILLFTIALSSGVTHLLLMMFGGATRRWTTTLSIFAFAYSPQVLGAVPLVGQLVGFVWMVVIAIIGLSAAHRTSTARAAAAVLAPLVVAFGVLVLVVMLVAMMGLA